MTPEMPHTGANGSQADCEEIYDSTQTVTLLAVPDAGWRFAGWGGECATNGADPSITLLTAQNVGCTASFVAIAPGSTLTVEVVNGAADRIITSLPEGISCNGDATSDCSETFAASVTEVRLLAPRPGFQSWQGCDDVLDSTTCLVVMDGSRTVTASYAP